MSWDVISPTADIAKLREQIKRVKEHARLTEDEWALLLMLEHVVAIIGALDERWIAQEAEL